MFLLSTNSNKGTVSDLNCETFQHLNKEEVFDNLDKCYTDGFTLDDCITVHAEGKGEIDYHSPTTQPSDLVEIYTERGYLIKTDSHTYEVTGENFPYDLEAFEEGDFGILQQKE